jgi:pimeloyl-ACP methyl ester carboxylesterase
VKRVWTALGLVLVVGTSAWAHPPTFDRPRAIKSFPAHWDLQKVMRDRPVASPSVRTWRPTPSASARTRPCPGDRIFRCGRVSVPLDRADPSGEQLRIAFEVLPARSSRPGLAPVFVTEGGPGGSTTSGRGFWPFVLGPMLNRRDLVLIDSRGTGKSGPIDCPDLQEGWDSVDELLAEVGGCGESLGDAADRYGSGDVAMDMDVVRAALGYRKLNYVGPSYGSVAVQAYAARFPQHLRAVVIDGGLTVTDPDYDWAWNPDAPAAILRAITLHCERAPACAASQTDVGAAFTDLVETVAADPVEGTGRDAFGTPHAVVIGEPEVAAIARAFGNDGEIAAAGIALSAGDPAPLLRLGAETPAFPGDHGPIREFSMGANAATFCNDQEFVWDRTASVPERTAAYNLAVAGLPPDSFAPFTVDGWIGHIWPDLCLNYPAPDRFEPAVPAGATFDTPALILSGDLDTAVPTELTQNVADLFPNSTFVEIAGAAHTPLGFSPCAGQIAARFVNRLNTGDTSCADEPTFLLPVVNEYPLTAADAAPAEPIQDGGDESTDQDRRVAAVAVGTVLDAFLRSFRQPVPDASGAGLRGGTFDAFYDRPSNARIDHNDLKWVEDVTVSGRSIWDYATSRMTTNVELTGPGTDDGELRIVGVWGFPFSRYFKIRGTIGGRTVDLRMRTN